MSKKKKKKKKSAKAKDCVRSMSLQLIGFFGTKKPIYRKINESVVPSVGFIF